MSSKRIFSWSKRQSGAENYYRTGGIVPIDASPNGPSNGVEAKATPKTERRRPSELRIITAEDKQFVQSPRSATYNITLANAASTLQAAFNDILRSPPPYVVACPRSASVFKPLPGRPRSLSLPLPPDLPAELPGSILQDNQGYPSLPAAEDPVLFRPLSQNVRRSTHPVIKDIEDEEDLSELLKLFPEPLVHARSVPDLGHQHSDMRSSRSGNTLNSGAAPKPDPLRVQQKKLLSETCSRERSSSGLVTSTPSPDSKLVTCPTVAIGGSSATSAKARTGRSKTPQSSSLIVEGQAWNSNVEHRVNRRSEFGSASTPTPTTTRSKQIEELKGTVSTQDQTISTLQTQFGSLRASHESHVASLIESHLAEVASLKNYTRVLEEQLAQRPSLHHASSNNLLFLLDTTEPQTPRCEESQQATEACSASSNKSSQSAPEEQQGSPQYARDSPEMENLKRKLSSTRRPQTANRNLVPELNQYKQNNVALQKQIESLMAKLNESKKSERSLKTSLEELRQKCDAWQEKAEDAYKAVKSAQALQNTIDHLENRLEIANTERLDAEEQLFNIQTQKSPFDSTLPKLLPTPIVHREYANTAQSAHLSISTVFSSDTPISPANELQGQSTLAAFVAHIERLQDQVRQKDLEISKLERCRVQLEQEQNAMALQMDIQSDLLKRTRRTDSHIEQLRAAVVDREAIIIKKEKSIRAVERQLEHHKLLLQAQIRRHAIMTLHSAVDSDPLPNLSTLTTRTDIDKWIEKLQERLQEEKSMISGKEIHHPDGAHVTNLRQEIDFYVREIIYYKLDIRGYKTDIKKLKKITAQLSSYGARASDLESDTSSLRPATTPSQPRYTPVTPELDSSCAPSPVLIGPISRAVSMNRPLTPPPSGSSYPTTTMNMAVKTRSSTKRVAPQRDYYVPQTHQTPDEKAGSNWTHNPKHVDLAISPRSATRASVKEKNSTPSSTERFGILLTKTLPLSAPYKQTRSMSESNVPLYTTTRQLGPSFAFDDEVVANKMKRSASVSEPGKGRKTPERPLRPRYGLFESPQSRRTTVLGPSSFPHVDLLAKTMNQFSNKKTIVQNPPLSRNNSGAPTMRVALPYMAKDTLDSGVCSPSTVPPAALDPRAGSVGSTTADIAPQVSSPSERKLSAASSSSIPFVIAMGSPHNPALMTIMPLSSCAITRNAPLKTSSTTSRVGVGGTMASYTPITSPVSLPGTSRPESAPWPTTTKPSSDVLAAQTRSSSFSRKQECQVVGSPHTPSHSRNASGSSIRTGIRLQMSREKEKEKETHKVRKDSISMPQPLGSPFDVDCSRTRGLDGWGEGKVNEEMGWANGVGEAI